MAVAYETHGIIDPVGSTTSIDIPKPTSLAEGDVMVAHIYKNNGLPSAKTGWYDLDGTVDSISTESGGQNYTGVCYKIADSSDVAASTFTFSSSGGSGIMGGAIIRISGSVDSAPNVVGSWASDVVTDTGTVNVPIVHNVSITPITADTLLLFLVSGGDGPADMRINDYAIATDNPTWTERYDSDGSSVGSVISVATATRTETTATGNAQFEIGGDGGGSNPSGAEDTVVFMVSIIPPIDSTFNADPLIVSATLPNPTYTADANYSPDPLAITATLPNPTFDAQQNAVWTNEDGAPDTTWTFENF